MAENAAPVDAPAHQELERRLKDLHGDLERVLERSREHLQPIWPAVKALDAAFGEKDHDAFVRALVKLAEVVIKLRQGPHAQDLGQLTVPPYDLWLPFKAASMTKTDQSGFTSQSPVYNDKIGSTVGHLAKLVVRAEQS